MDNKNSKKSLILRVGGLVAAAVAAGLIFTHSWADPQDDAAFTCASAVNVMDCIKQTGTGVNAPLQEGGITSIPINSQALGFTGPVTVGLRYDNYLAWILDVGYAQAYKNTAAAFKLSAGLNERRANVTLGYAITPKQQIKLTYEYLAQNLPFDYAAGTVNQWVNQNALGGAYQYMLNYGILSALEVSANYTKAQSKELSTVDMYTDNVLTQLDYRRIAGGTQENVMGGVTLTPFQGTILKVGAGYSSLSFDTKWESNEANAVLAYNVDLSQLLTPTLMVGAGVGTTAAGSTYTAKVSKILPWSLEAALIGQYTATTSDIPSATTMTASLSYPAPKTYTNAFSQGLSNLKSWVQTPVIYNTRVLAKAEEKLVAVNISYSQIPAQPIPVGTLLTPLYTKDYFSYSSDVYDKIIYNISTITNKADGKQIDPSLNNLNLVAVPVDSFNYQIKSTAPTTPTMLTNGQNAAYTVTLQAQGYRNGAVVTQQNGNFDVNVEVNKNIPAPSWNTKATLTSGVAGQPYPTTSPGNTDLRTLVVDNSGLPPPGDSYTFQITPGGTADNYVKINGNYLIGNGNSFPPSTATYNIILHVTSLASGNSPPDQSYNLTVTATSQNPTWTNQNTPNATISKPYSQNLADPSYIDSGYAGSTMTFKCTTCSNTDGQGNYILPITGLILTKNGFIQGTATDINQINLTPTPPFTVVATNDLTTKASQPKDFTIALKPDNTMPAPTWNNNAGTEYAPANLTSNIGAYNQDLNNYFNGSASGDQLTYTLNSKGTCNWLANLDSSNTHYLKNNAAITQPTSDCGISITVKSTLSGNSSTFAGSTGKVLRVLGAGPTWTKTTLPDLTYLSSNNLPIDLSTYVTNSSDSTDTFTFTLATGSQLPGGLSLSSDGKITGQPTDINTINSQYHPVTIPVTILATSVKYPSQSPSSQTFTVNIKQNTSLAFNPSWTGTLPQAINTQPYQGVNLGTYITVGNDKIENYVLTSQTCYNSWLSMLDATAGTLGTATGVYVGVASATGGNTSCTATITVSSLASGKTQPFTQPITIIVGPKWLKNTLPTNFPVYYGTTAYSVNIDSTYVTSQTGDNVTIVAAPSPAVKPDWVTVPSTSTNSAPITTNNTLNVNDVISQDTCNTANVSDPTKPYVLTLQASDRSGFSQQSFVICLLPNSSLTAPVYVPENNSAVALPQSISGNPYPAININPYDPTSKTADNPNGDKYLTFTKQGSNQISDNLTFTLTDNSGCPWLLLSNNGTLSSTAKVTTSCQFTFTVKSTAMGVTLPFNGRITLGGTAPSWNSIPNQTIKLTVTDPSQAGAINLSNYLVPGNGANLAVQVTADDKPSYLNNWTIKVDGQGKFYLVRAIQNFQSAPALDAADVDTSDRRLTQNLTVTASTNVGPPASTTVNVTVQPDTTLIYKWMGNSAYTGTIGDPQQYFTIMDPANPQNDLIKTYTSDGSTLILNDVIQMAYGTGGSSAFFQSYSARQIYYVNCNNCGAPTVRNNYFMVQNYSGSLSNTDAGTYPGTNNDTPTPHQTPGANLRGIYSQARGGSTNKADCYPAPNGSCPANASNVNAPSLPGINLTLYAKLAWSKTNASILYDQLDNSNIINLNGMMDNTFVSNLRFEFQDGPWPRETGRFKTNRC